MLPLLMFLAFLLMPVLEIYVIIQVGALIGGWQTAALLLAESLLGAWIVRREGRRAWNTLRGTFERGVMPDRELADAALVLAGGVLLLTPGFVTDVVGFAFVLPFTRPLVRRLAARYAARRVRIAERRLAEEGLPGMFPPGMDFGAPTARDTRTAGSASGPVIRGEVLRDDTPDR
ncbi:MAG TPA: FxsA family protein [Thermomonospora sp.]|nr:FxsA family protein [Thermomonospora sp.]